MRRQFSGFTFDWSTETLWTAFMTSDAVGSMDIKMRQIRASIFSMTAVRQRPTLQRHSRPRPRAKRNGRDSHSEAMRHLLELGLSAPKRKGATK
jgi:hypothetical protein